MPHSKLTNEVNRYIWISEIQAPKSIFLFSQYAHIIAAICYILFTICAYENLNYCATIKLAK